MKPAHHVSKIALGLVSTDQTATYPVEHRAIDCPATSAAKRSFNVVINVPDSAGNNAQKTTARPAPQSKTLELISSK